LLSNIIGLLFSYSFGLVWFLITAAMHLYQVILFKVKCLLLILLKCF